jgi:glycosyltransferase involved in cell wall biosynthesis
MKRIRVCLCVDDLFACGAQQIVRNVVENLDSDRYEPLVYAFRRGPLADAISNAGVTVRIFPRHVPKLDLALVNRLRARLQSDRIDILHMHLFGATLHGLLAAFNLPKLARMVTLHCPREDNVLQRAVYPMLFSMSESIVGVSKDVTASLLRRYGRSVQHKIVTISNGIDVRRFQADGDKGRLLSSLNIPSNARIVGTVGRLSPEKGHTVLLDAFACIKERCPNAFLILVGEGAELDSLLRHSADRGISESVRFLGARQDVPALLKAMDVFVLSSLWEGLPVVLLEAMAAGIPVVATMVGGVREVVESEREGLLVPASNPQALASAVIRLLDDHVVADQLRNAAMSKVESQFSVGRMVHAYEALYSSLSDGPHIFEPRGRPVMTHDGVEVSRG